MSRLGEGSAGMARSMAIAAVAPGGSFAVGSALVLDELEHHRAGIGCMLESGGRGVVISVVVPGFVFLRASPAPRADSGRLCRLQGVCRRRAFSDPFSPQGCCGSGWHARRGCD
jgi:hypothetical protein